MRERRGLGVQYCLLILLSSLILLTGCIDYSYGSESRKEHDIEWLAYNIYHEARGEDIQGKIVIALVTINRVESPEFPNNIQKVITQPGQFSWYWDGKPDQPQEPKAYDECFAVSQMVMNLWETGYADDLIRQMNLDSVQWYHNESVSPYWADDYQFVAQIGKHKVYKKRDI